MKILKSIAGVLCLVVFLLLPSCNKSPVTVPAGNWVHIGDFNGVPRSGAFSFTIVNASGGSTFFAGLGYSSTATATAPHYVNDCWSFDGHIWRQIAPFPGELRERAVAFAINGKGYVGTGYNRNLATVTMKDFWEYDPSTNQWRQLNDFGGTARYNAVGFATPDYGYVGTGLDDTYLTNDFWEYHPTDDSWTQIESYGGQKRQSATVVQIDNKFYLMSGTNNNSAIFDAWQFDPSQPENKRWLNVAPLATDPQYANFKLAVGRYDAVGFSLDSKGYISTGVASGVTKTTFQYDPNALTWTKMTDFERSPRSKAIAAVIDGRIFLGTGASGASYFDDVEEFQPYLDYDPND